MAYVPKKRSRSKYVDGGCPVAGCTRDQSQVTARHITSHLAAEKRAEYKKERDALVVGLIMIYRATCPGARVLAGPVGEQLSKMLSEEEIAAFGFQRPHKQPRVSEDAGACTACSGGAAAPTVCAPTASTVSVSGPPPPVSVSVTVPCATDVVAPRERGLGDGEQEDQPSTA